VSGSELSSSIIPNSAGVFRFDVKYNLSEEMVWLKITNKMFVCMLLE